ncbi:OLC1v1037081C1 [Oldenlandia corymbosa var. corymbosa]|uniref:OLC1v1037081C1 n=1 Tax=Oldenlandia corymbosa var. corymbosa TaxID=529605 RepID=A0AAV1CXQ6_OLDCO|nr:OLC1v1037081C1 [Oldenlandia corymbosa var. corymbosa]
MAAPTSGMITNENNNDDIVEVDNNTNPGENAPLPEPFFRSRQHPDAAGQLAANHAKELIQQCVNAFIGMITREANDQCKREHRKTIQSEDLLYTMNKLGFHDYVEPLMDYLQRYREFNHHGGSLPSFSSSSSLAAAVENPTASGQYPTGEPGQGSSGDNVEPDFGGFNG